MARLGARLDVPQDQRVKYQAVIAYDHNHQGITTQLLDELKAWGRECGCTELASDALVSNHDSDGFHTAIGFVETERVVCFRSKFRP